MNENKNDSIQNISPYIQQKQGGKGNNSSKIGTVYKFYLNWSEKWDYTIFRVKISHLNDAF